MKKSTNDTFNTIYNFTDSEFWEAANFAPDWVMDLDPEAVNEHFKDTSQIPILDHSDDGIANFFIDLSQGHLLYAGQASSDEPFYAYDGTIWYFDHKNITYNQILARLTQLCKFWEYASGIKVLYRFSSTRGLMSLGNHQQDEATLRRELARSFARNRKLSSPLTQAIKHTHDSELLGWYEIHQTSKKLVDKLTGNQSEKNISQRIKKDSRIRVSHSDFDHPSSNLLPVANGVLNLESGELEDNSKNLLFTKKTRATFNPEATCPNFLAALSEFMEGDAEKISYLQLSLGSALVGAKNKGRCVFNYGSTAGNGKSTIMDTIMFLMGDLGTCLDPADLFGGNSSEYSLAKLQGKRFILVNETDRPHELKKYNSTMVKQLVNSGSVQGRHPYGKPFDFDVIATIFVNSNHNPASFLPSEEGVLRRLALLEWNYTIDRSKMIDDFASQHLHPELSGILNWMLEGVKRHKEIGLKPPQQLLESMLSHFKEADTYHNFMICCVEQGSSKDRIKLTDLYNLYLEWYRANVSNGSLNLKHATLKLELERLGFDVKKGQGGAHFVYEVRFPDGFYIDSPDSINRLVKEGLAGFKATIFLKNNAFIKFRESGDLSNAA